MMRKDPCDGCGEKIHCSEAYRRLGNVSGPPIVLNVITAFVLPLVVFIAVMVIAQRVLAVRVESENLRTAIAVLLALGIAAVCVAVARITIKWLGKK